jgi:proteic killer suppression protein
MIKSFAGKETEKVFNREFSRKRPPEIQPKAKRKMDILNAADSLQDLRVPPGNHLEALHGDREGQYSIKIKTNGGFVFTGLTITPAM